MVFERPVSAIEQFYLALSGTFSHLVIQVVIEGKGAISADQLKRALNKVSLGLPGVCLRLQGKKWLGNGPAPRMVRLSEYPDFRFHLNQSVRSYSSFHPELGRTCEVALAQRENDCLLVFRALHAVMDGNGLRRWATAVFQALRGEDVAPRDSSLTDDEVARSQKAPMRRDEPSFPRQIGPGVRIRSSVEAHTFDFARRSVTGSIPGIVAKIAIAVRKLLCSKDTDKSCVMVPVDLRRAMPELCSSTANLSFPLFLPVEAEESWPDVSHRLLAQLNEKQYLTIDRKNWLYHRMPHSIVSWICRHIWSSELKRGKYLFSAVISHIGKQELEEFRAPDFEAESICFLPCAMPVAPLSFVITEHDAGTEICLVKPRPLWNEPAELLDKVLELAGLPIDETVRPDSEVECIFGVPIKGPDRVPDISIRLNEAAQKYGDQVALYDGDVELSYKEFIARRDHLAAVLVEAAGKSLEGERIALLMNRSVEAFLLIHACLELGAPFIPIDPNYPEERIRRTLEDSKPILLIYDESSTVIDGVRSISANTLVNRSLGADGILPETIHKASNLAYIMYTSGTRGQPKGVCVTRSNLSHYIGCAEKEFFLPYRHRGAPLVTSLSFDISIPPLFAPLLQGCKVRIVREQAPPLALQQVLNDPDMTFSMMTPAHLEIMMGLGRKPASQWQCLAIGGETVSVGLCRRARVFFGPQLDVLNAYGPTETTVSVTHYRFNHESDSGEAAPIAKGPIDCAGLYILKDDLSPCKAGEEGELYISGHTVSNGYWENDRETREHFLPDPFLKQGLMYRSGDRGVYRNGKIYFVCRDDDQVKIHGYRIELEEIATRMRQYSGIENAVVLFDQSGLKAVLRGIFTTSTSIDIDSRNLKAFLGKSLPHFMVPAHFHKADEIPFTISGKVDRQLLLSRIGATTVPVDEREENTDVGDIWSSCLRVPRDQLSLDSDFFELGGDSVLLLEILQEVNRVLCGGNSASALFDGLKDFFVNPQLVQMIRLVESLDRKA